MKKTGLLFLAIAGVLATAVNPYAARVDFTPELFVSEEYTDNLFLDYDDDAKVDDFITTAGLSLTLEVLGQTDGLEVNYTPSYSTFADNDDLDYWRHSARLRTWHDFRRNTRLQLTSTYLETEDPRDRSDETVDDGTAGPPDIDVDRTRRNRDRTMRSANELRLSHQFGARNTVYGAVAYNLSKEVDPPDGADVDDYREVQPEFGLEYWLDQNWGMRLNSYYADRDYEDRDDRKEIFGSARLLRNFNRRLSGFVQYRHTYLDFDDDGTEEDYQVYAPSVGIQYQFKENTSLSIGAGYYFQDFDESDDDSGTFVETELNNTWNFRRGYLRLIASSGYDIEDTGAVDLGLQIYYLGRVEARHNFTPRFFGDGYMAYRNDDYPSQEPNRSDQTTNVGAGLGYQALRWMTLRLEARHENVSSDSEIDEYTENSVIFTVTMAPANPFRLN